MKGGDWSFGSKYRFYVEIFMMILSEIFPRVKTWLGPMYIKFLCFLLCSYYLYYYSRHIARTVASDGGSIFKVSR